MQQSLKRFCCIEQLIQTGVPTFDRVELLEKIFNPHELLRVERVRRDGARTPVDHDAGAAILLPQAVCDLEFLLRPRQIFFSRLLISGGRRGAEAMPQDSDEYV